MHSGEHSRCTVLHVIRCTDVSGCLSGLEKEGVGSHSVRLTSQTKLTAYNSQMNAFIICVTLVVKPFFVHWYPRAEKKVRALCRGALQHFITDHPEQCGCRRYKMPELRPGLFWGAHPSGVPSRVGPM